jgi:CheY-like chemotaxis protein
LFQGDRPSSLARGKSVLIIDDEPQVLSTLAMMLAADGHEVDGAPSGTVALQKLEARAYDVILCDVKMPGLDGPGLYRELQRRHPELCRRMIFITGYALGSELTELLEQTPGARWLRKPIRVSSSKGSSPRLARHDPPPSGRRARLRASAKAPSRRRC